MTMTVSAGVVTGAATAGTASGVTQFSVDGLFASLLGASEDVTALPVDTSNLTQDTSIAMAKLQVLQTVEIGSGQEVMVHGDADVVASFVKKLQMVVGEIGNGGKLPSGSELSAALQEQGMPADEADQLAQRIDTMLSLLKKNNPGMDDKTEGTLGAMLLAAMMSQSQGNGSFEIQLVQVDSTLQVTDLTARMSVNIQNFSQAAGLSAADLARQMMAQNGQKDVAAKGDSELVGDFGTKAAPEGAKVEQIAGSGPLLPPAKMVVTVDVKKSDDGAVLSVPVQDTQADARAVAGTVPQPVKVEVNRAAEAGATAVSKVMEKPEGETLYKWQVDKNGEEKVTAVQPQPDTAASNVLTGQQIAAQHHLEAVRTQDATQTFAERLQAAAQNRVAEQVAIQIKPVAEHGGGTVRMTLNPPELGQVQIDLTVGHDGRVHGAIAATDPVVVEQLARELHSLRHGLADAGLKLGEQGINLMLSNNGGQQGQGQQQAQAQANAQQQRQGGQASFEDGVAATGDAQPEIAAHWVAPERVLDVRI